MSRIITLLAALGVLAGLAAGLLWPTADPPTSGQPSGKPPSYIDSVQANAACSDLAPNFHISRAPSSKARWTFMFHQLHQHYVSQSTYETLAKYLFNNGCSYSGSRNASEYKTFRAMWHEFLAARKPNDQNGVQLEFTCYSHSDRWGTYMSTLLPTIWERITLQTPLLSAELNCLTFSVPFNESGIMCGFFPEHAWTWFRF